MKQLSNQEIMEVSGATERDANAVAAGIMVGGAAGFLIGGPVGAVAGAISVGAHAAFISHFWEG
jgi:osmotically inducible lipoprotein OsmB